MQKIAGETVQAGVKCKDNLRQLSSRGLRKEEGGRGGEVGVERCLKCSAAMRPGMSLLLGGEVRVS